MASHERLCFAEAAEVPLDAIHLHFMSEGKLTNAELRGVDTVFFGGSGAYSVNDDVQWIRDGLEALLRVVDQRVPAWASCFGFQGLARAMGGEVVRDDEREEMGAVELQLTAAGRADPLMSTLPDRFWGEEGHHDRVTTLPAGVIRMVTGTVCPEQAFRVDGAPFWASQFHPELTPERTAARFEHYREHYFRGPAEEADATLEKLRTGPSTPAVGQLLRQLVRGGFH